MLQLNQRNCQELYKQYQEKALETVKRLDQGEPFYKIAKSYGFQKDGYRNWLANNGYYKKRLRKLAFDEELIKEAHNYCLQGYSIAEAARKLNVNDETLAKDLKQLYDYKPLADGKKRIDDNYFENIDSNEKAYWLGFILADGYNGDKNFEFSQCDKNKDAVAKFKEAIKSQHKISKKNVNGHIEWRINIRSKKLHNDLLNLGITSDKSYTALLPNIKDQYIPSFLRGYFDGDGSIYSRKDALPIVSFTSASINLLKDIQKWLEKNQINSCIYEVNVGRSKNTNWGLFINTKIAAKFLNIIYKDSTENTRLDSKYDKYISILNCRPELKTI